MIFARCIAETCGYSSSFKSMLAIESNQQGQERVISYLDDGVIKKELTREEQNAIFDELLSENGKEVLFSGDFEKGMKPLHMYYKLVPKLQSGSPSLEIVIRAHDPQSIRIGGLLYDVDPAKHEVWFVTKQLDKTRTPYQGSVHGIMSQAHSFLNAYSASLGFETITNDVNKRNRGSVLSRVRARVLQNPILFYKTTVVKPKHNSSEVKLITHLNEYVGEDEMLHFITTLNIPKDRT